MRGKDTMFKKLREIKYALEIDKMLKLNPFVQGIAYGRIRNNACMDLMDGKISEEFYKKFFTMSLDKLRKTWYNTITKRK